MYSLVSDEMLSSKWTSLQLISFYFLVVPGHAKSIRCSNPVPGVQRMVKGVDITKLDLTPSKPGSDGFKSPVLKLTCGDENRWLNAQGKDEYELPDQIWEITPLSDGWQAVRTDTYKSYREMREKMTRDVGGEGSIWEFAFSGSHSYATMQNIITNNSKFILEVSDFDSATRVDLSPSWVLEMDRFAKIFIDQIISGTFENNQSVYFSFIDHFGTHYFSSANFGGLIREVLETNKELFSIMSDPDVTTKAKASLLNIITQHGGHVTTSSTVDEKFSNATTHYSQFFGGDNSVLLQDGFQKWKTTVEKNPWLFSGKLAPISELIEDEDKRSSMERAVETYVLRGYLNELDRLVGAAKARSDDPSVTSLQRKVFDMKKKPFLDLNKVKNLGSEVDEQIIVPNWFKANTQLCYKWHGDDDLSQCGGGADKLLCAKPNIMTRVYKDDTDQRNGGCQMQWGIQSSGFPSWFSEVKICYKWLAEVDIGQCSERASGVICAGINEFTTPYRDDTDQRSGLCQMSWKMEVPSSAPIWLKTAKICFSWSPDGDATQCGPDTPRDLCAPANEWTYRYRDDTDNRPGGCLMSWGLQLVF